MRLLTSFDFPHRCFIDVDKSELTYTHRYGITNQSTTRDVAEQTLMISISIVVSVVIATTILLLLFMYAFDKVRHLCMCVIILYS